MTPDIQLDEFINPMESKSLWVFGYGSLCWRPGFEFDKAVIGHIKGFSRKFWQGNTVHRGTLDKPGRVVTLIEDDNNATVHGVAFAISGDAAVSYLSQRECKLGGYETKFTTFYPSKGEPIRNILLYIATPMNALWLGDSPVPDMAAEILETKGICGHNAEYLLRLASFMRQYCPNIDDAHLYSLESEVMKRIIDNNMCLKTLMGEGKDCITFTKVNTSSNEVANAPVEVRPNSFQFTATVSSKSLRCLNI